MKRRALPVLLAAVLAAGGAAADFKGETITVAGPWRGEDRAAAEAVFDRFRKETGAEVRYTPRPDGEILADPADALPDIAFLTRPEHVGALAAKGRLAPLGEAMRTWLAENYAAGAAFADLVTHQGADGATALFAFPWTAEVTSLVWYVPENFAAAGYDVPQSMEALRALTERIAADGRTPWCIGLGAGGASGWPAIDWVGDLLLAGAGPEVHARWTAGALSPDDPALADALVAFDWFALNDAFVAGGAAGVAETDFRDSIKGLFTTPPACYLHRQRPFAAAFLPEDASVDVFAMPAGDGRPVVGTGTLAVVTRDSPMARAFVAFLATPAAHAAAQPAFVTPFRGADRTLYAGDLARRQADLLAEATRFHFAGPALAPEAAGALRQAVLDRLSAGR